MSNANPLPSQELLRELYDYNPDTGVFARKTKTGTRKLKPMLVSHYRQAQVNGTKFFVARLIWMWVYGRDPKNMYIDHINGNRADNRIKNLRLVSPIENSRNMRLYKTNKTGIPGIDMHKGKYRVRIKINKNEIYLGYYEDLDEAIAVRKKAEQHFGFHKNHGNFVLAA
jgi:hypothetical protein